ncbi:RT0821/Lpp0805 family surface protein [Candidatus Berkiella aquae]|uniref:Glycine zipper 2TM domain-containing protein n=1 Tax=Candidatus Berkiella aquae TaxID=295108 RepID=A0A0Q9YKR1_9GAMM|nr:RT0821/Lpp0805 family surface protein [Candidatus Berkiella aquae]MCS5711044.1 glycine zipper 2TM domain-containing protein [Candidatus Berkiella aquae]
MKDKYCLPLIVLVSTSLLVGCQSMGGSNREAAGTVIGGAGGAFIGSQFGQGAGRWAGGAVGFIAGAVAGNAIGRYLDESDNREARNAFRAASCAPVGETVYWENGRTGHWGWYQPRADGHSRYGNYCREFAMKANINGRSERVYGTACRRPNGTWYEL